jgi:hypothetical protein
MLRDVRVGGAPVPRDVNAAADPDPVMLSNMVQETL